MLAGVVHVAGLLVGPRQSKLGRGVMRIQLQRMVEGFNGLRKLPGLHVRRAQKIPGVGIVRINFGDPLEIVNRRRRVAGILGQQSQAVPGVRILRILLKGLLKSGPAFLYFLQVAVGHAFIQSRNRKFRVSLRRLLKTLQRLLEQLLIHVRRTQIVQTRGLHRIRSLELRLRRRGKKAEGSQDHGSESNRDSGSHHKNLTTKDTKDHEGNRFLRGTSCPLWFQGYRSALP